MMSAPMDEAPLFYRFIGLFPVHRSTLPPTSWVCCEPPRGRAVVSSCPDELSTRLIGRSLSKLAECGVLGGDALLDFQRGQVIPRGVSSCVFSLPKFVLVSSGWGWKANDILARSPGALQSVTPIAFHVPAGRKPCRFPRTQESQPLNCLFK